MYIGILGVVIAISLYLNVLATLGSRKDDTLQAQQRVSWIVIVWLFPIVGSLLSLRSTAENSPASLLFLAGRWPVSWLINLKNQQA